MNYTISFKDYNNEPIEVIIYKDSNPFATSLLASSNPLTITRTVENADDLFSLVSTSKCNIRIQITDGMGDFLNDMETLKEGEMKVTINRTSSGVENIWRGILIPDQQTRKFNILTGEIEITAIDLLSQMKGKKLLNADNVYVTEEHTIKEYADFCINQVAGISSSFFSNIILTKDTAYTLPTMPDQFSLYADTFNDDEGRPIYCYDVIKYIAEAFNLTVNTRADVLEFVDFAAEKYSRFSVGFKGDGKNATLINNSESINTTRTFFESIAKYNYRKSIGLITDGYFLNWTSIGGGYKLTNWEYNPQLSGSSDVYTRRKGSDRPQNPYAILLERDVVFGTGGAPDTHYSDIIAGQVSKDFVGGESLELEITMSFDTNIDFILSYPYKNKLVRKTVFQVVLYNEDNPSLSYVLRTNVTGVSSARELKSYWYVLDLSGSSGADFAAGNIPWTDANLFGNILAPAANNGYIMPPIQTWDYENQYAIPTYIRGMIVEPSLTNNIQRINTKLPTLPPIQSKLKAFVFLQPILQMQWTSGGLNPTLAPNATARTLFYSAFLTSQQADKDKNNPVTGEVVYISRFGDTSAPSVEKEVKINTTFDSGAGSLRTPISYTKTSTGTIVPAGNVPTISVSGTLEFDNITLIDYNARKLMIYNYNQYLIDFEIVVSKLTPAIRFNMLLDMSALYDPLRPATAIYNEPFRILSSTYDVKKSQYKITACSLKQNKRNFSKNTLNVTNDLVEEYYLR